MALRRLHTLAGSCKNKAPLPHKSAVSPTFPPPLHAVVNYAKPGAMLGHRAEAAPHDSFGFAPQSGAKRPHPVSGRRAEGPHPCPAQPSPPAPQARRSTRS